MFRNTILIQNLNCNQCALEVKDRLSQLKNISNVLVHLEFSHILLYNS